VSHHAMDRLAAGYDVKDPETVLALERVLDKLVARATDVYSD